MATCAQCDAENRDGAKFCGNCGSSLALACPRCGASNESGQTFCNECGASLASEAGSATAATAPPRRDAPVAERRRVSVLFADLVGFTPLSESRDPEEVRELLSRYFESCRRLVELYGGVVEKFIGDAVMAVWGTPTAQEDDAERAVRTALDLVAAVTALGDEVGAPDLRARAGVLTGEAAVNLAAVGEGMVAGDLVNTAARIQAAAEPGTVLVGEATRRSSDRAIAFENAGEHLLKGKTEPVSLSRAVRVTAARGGALRSERLEAPFVGRRRELRLVKERFHASAEQSRAQFVQITGIAGIGKSRLAWEFFKYLDGLAEPIWWHRGRCLAYGEGVAYWALAEMVRMRAQILEGEDQDAAREKLAACLDEHVTEPEERAWVGPRLANLLGLEERADTDRQDLFAAWRLFFERLADQSPVVLVFEDLQWADQAMLAFVEYLLEWSSAQRLYVLALSRPELGQSQPEFGRGVRNSTNLGLEPLSDEQMTALLYGYAPGLPEELTGQVLARAQGVPLYAVETVRMLLDRGLLAQDGAVYRPTGEIATLEIPESLHALAAARLDGLPGEERQLVQEACVLGKSFTTQALAALTGRSEEELEPLLAGLVKKEVLGLQADPRWPERGQYGFLQELLREVAYETLSRRDRKARHLAAVTALEQSFQGADQEVPEVLATHLLAAAEAGPDDSDVGEIRLRARAALVQAADRAAGLAAPEEARQYLDQAATLARDEPLLQAELLARAGVLAFQAGSTADARQRLEQALTLHAREGDAFAAARAGIALADVDMAEGLLEEARRRLEGLLPTLEQAGPSAELAATLAQLGRMFALRGEQAPAASALERALRLSEALALEEVLARALTSKAMVLLFETRLIEARSLLETALARAHAAGLHDAWVRAANNLSVVLEQCEQYADVLALTEEVEAHARQRGDRERLVIARLGAIPALFELGRWQEALARTDEKMEASPWARSEAITAVPIFCEQGRIDDAQAFLDEQELGSVGTEFPEQAATLGYVEARLLRAQDRPLEALAAAERGIAHRSELGNSHRTIKHCLVEGIEAANDLDDNGKAEQLLAILDKLQPGELTPSMQAQHVRFRARLDARQGDHDTVDADYRSAELIFQRHGLVFHHAATETEHAEWLIGQDRANDAEPLIAHARETFERLEAQPWLQRLNAIHAAAPTEIRV
jgi:predicted ATPase/class 3 adenylate cyclase